ncbi:MAG: elongation factor G [Candidatus Bipolaricaulota bacterium]|nr:elongation factor G [Candidatus Bipolaricaulota bacterium]MDW8152378.1 elongation factor G [Candidatus Bipolaricaulota bacterium]
MSRIRNIGIAAHIDAGKTTLSEAMLFLSGRKHRFGAVDAGEATLDWMPQERERGITITAAATTLPWKGHAINLIDTPGHVDFTAEVERALRVVDGMIALFCAVGGVEAQSEAIWRQAERYGVPRLAFVNKMDRVGADFFGVLEEMRRDLGANPVPLVLPIGAEDGFRGLIDLLTLEAILLEEGEHGAEPPRLPIPAELRRDAEAARERLLEAVAEADDRFLELFLAGEASPEELRAALRRATLAGKIVPVFAGSAAQLKGVRRLLDAVVELLPSPADLPAVRGTWAGQPVARAPSPEEPLSALIFKIQADRHVGKVYFVRVYSGVLRSGASVLHAGRGEVQRVGHLFRVHADERLPVEELGAGEVGALVGLEEAHTGDTLCDPAAPILLEAMEFPAPVLDLAVSPARRTDADRLSRALAALAAEDPTLALRADPETGELVVSGMGELHLEIVVDRLRREFGVEVVAGAPQVAYRETPLRAGEFEHKHVKQTGGRGQYAHLLFRVEPAAPGTGLEFESRVVGGRVPKEYIPAVRKGLAEAMAQGPLGFPVVDLKFILLDGSYHEVDSSEQAFRTCAAQALREALAKLGTLLLEPVMRVEAAVPEASVGAVVGDLAARRGKLLALEQKGSSAVVVARVPLAELFGYATTLRSLTSGRGSFTLRFERYEPVPEALVPKVAKRAPVYSG